MRRTLQILVATLLLLLAPMRAGATTNCSATMTNIDFSTVNPFGGNVDVTATLNYTCTYSCVGLGCLIGGLSASFVRMCFSIADGVQGGGNFAPRRMTSGSNNLQFQLYQDAARSQVWGSLSQPQPLQRDLQFGLFGNNTSQSGSATLYGRVPSGQTALVPGSYVNNFTGGHTALNFRYSEALLGLGSFPASCTSGGSAGTASTFAFNALASVVKQCNPSFTVDDIDFGTRGLLSGNVDVTATLRPQCTSTTPYQIGLSNGLNASGSIRRMKSAANAYVSYELYRDSGRSLRWGTALGSDTVSATGTGSAQALTVYGRVAPQTTPAANNYSDTVTVTIIY